MQLDPYVVKTIQLFRVQALAAKAAGDAEQAAAFEEAIRSLLDDTGEDVAPASASEPVPVALMS